MSLDPMHDKELLRLAELEQRFEKLLRQLPDTAEWGPLRFVYFASAERYRREIDKRIKDNM